MIKKTRASSIDVARLANVSRSTVSLVINNVENVRISDETRARVLEAASKLGYKPNARGRSLVSGKTDTIALVLRDLELLEQDLYLQPLLCGIVEHAQKSGFGLRVESGQRLKQEGRTIRDLITSGYVDGLIVENLDYRSADVLELIDEGAPIIALSSQGAAREYSVQIDNEGAAFEATRHLLEIGRRRIAHITYSPRGVHSTDRRFEGYSAALAAQGIAFDPTLVGQGNFCMESGYEAMARLLRTHKDNPPDAVFAGSDTIAIGAMAAISDAGFAVPDDVAVVGFDDLGISSIVRPSLTTVRSHPRRAGEVAASMLLDLLKGTQPERMVHTVKTDLIKRGSTLKGFDRGKFVLEN